MLGHTATVAQQGAAATSIASSLIRIIKPLTMFGVSRHGQYLIGTATGLADCVLLSRICPPLAAQQSHWRALLLCEFEEVANACPSSAGLIAVGFY